MSGGTGVPGRPMGGWREDRGAKDVSVLSKLTAHVKAIPIRIPEGRSEKLLSDSRVPLEDG